ncbi:MAG: sulfite reductase subunit beta (hemoprotein) [Planctomycetota bacterium]|nr:MAG: sulfite reductase subunit beta (hemoprotein) [Planctomycetota bacterium]
MKFYQTADTLIAEQDQFDLDVNDFIAGKIEPVKFKAIRVAHGVYEQRKEETYMIRIRCAAGGITPSQFKVVGELAEKYGSGEVHVTTRQEVQIHYVRAENILRVIRGLNVVSLSSRGGGGNTIRNILTPPDSGIDPDEEFDVDPYAIALTSRLIQEPDSWNLPRKFKINFSNSKADKSYTQATCLGFVALMKDGKKGFYVTCAGGMGAKPMVGHTLIDWIPDAQVYHVARALKTMFDKNGNRRSRTTNRIKFLWKKIGEDSFQDLFLEEYNKIKDDASLALNLIELDNSTVVESSLSVEVVDKPEFEIWKKRFVNKQKQEGLFSILLPLKLGDIEHSEVNRLADFLENFGDNTIRCTRAQNLLLRNIPEKYLGNAFNTIQKIETLSDRASFIGQMVNCTGASTCKLGICLPRGLSSAISSRLVGSDLDLDRLSDFKLNMSGCPNTCGLHHIADLGFFGKVSRHNGKMYPGYNVLAGAQLAMGDTKYAEKVSTISSKAVPDFVHDFLEDYLTKMDSVGSYKEYLEVAGIDKIKSLCEHYKDIPDFDDDQSSYIDFGATKPLSLEEIGTAECSAGMFDMIDVDKKLINLHNKRLSEATTEEDEQKALYKVLFSSSRMLLVTRGLDAKKESDAFAMFKKHFIEAGLIDEKFGDVVTLGKLNVVSELVNHKDLIVELSAEVIKLHKSMDDSLRFNIENKKVAEEKSVAVDEITFKDFRGVACPMNFVKTKMVLASLKGGDKLKILLDDGEPINNVPNSVKLEGHKILEQSQETEGHWQVLIEKA